MSEHLTYSKIFSDFKEGIDVLTNFVPKLKDYVGDAEDEQEAMENVLKAFSRNMPITSNPNYPYTYTFRADARGIIFTTDIRMNFGWGIRRINDDQIVYIFRVSFPNSPSRSMAEQKLIDDNWKITTFETNPRLRRLKRQQEEEAKKAEETNQSDTPDTVETTAEEEHQE